MKPAYLWVAIAAIVLFAAVIYVRMPKGVRMDKNQPEAVPTQQSEQPAAPAMVIDTTKMYTATLSTTEGDIVIKLNAKETPKTVNNFVYLAQQKFYDTTVFHRVIPGFMIQGGDPKGNGTGGPGYRFDDEPFTGEYTRGTVAMANAGPDTNGSQFFIMHADFELEHAYTIFGEVIQGLDVVDRIATAETFQDGRENSKPKNPVTVRTVTVTEVQPEL